MVSSVDGLAGAAAVGFVRCRRRVAMLRRRRYQGLGGEQALDFTPGDQASQPPDIALA
jgi:hypothetical protein